MMRVPFLQAVVLLCFALAVRGQSSGRDAKFFDSRRFWDGFERGISEAGNNMQKRLDSNMETAMDHLSNFRENVGHLHKRIESEVQESFPAWMRDEDTTTPNRRYSLGPQDAPIEAVVGTLGGDGLDDGLEVFFDGDSEREKFPVPHIIPRDSFNFFEGATPSFSAPAAPEDDRVAPPRTGGPLFDMRFGFSDRPFAMYPRLPQVPLFSSDRLDNIFGWRVNTRKPWWSGEFVCVDETEIDEAETTTNSSIIVASMQVQSCSEKNHKYTCTTRTRGRGINRTLRQEYRCCHGYVREAEGCTRVEMVPLADSLEGMDLTEFLTLAKGAGAIEMLANSNLTIFAPTDEAIQDYTADLTERNDLEITDNEVYRRKRSTDSTDLQSMVYTHMTEGFLYAGDMEDEMVLPSMTPNASIRINVYGHQLPPIVTANCARVLTANQHSSNGIIHTLERVMTPATRSIGDIIGNDPQFTTLKKLVSVSGMLPQLRDEGQLTLFAPTDAAFTGLPAGELDSLMDGSPCLNAVLKNHILPNVICSAAVTSPEAKTANLLEKFLKVRMLESGKLFVEDAQVVAKDIIATNGVIHIIDAPLMPMEAQPIIQVLESQNLTRFLELLNHVDMTKELTELKSGDITLFVPTNEGIDSLGDEYINELKENPDNLREVLRYHMAPSTMGTDSFRNNHVTDTLAGHPLRMNQYQTPFTIRLSSLLRTTPSRPRLTAGCGVVTLQESRACGAAIHLVDTLLVPAKQRVMEKLQDPEFSIFKKMVEESSLHSELSGVGPFTVLAPTDHVFRTLPEAELDSLMEDQDLKESLVKRHVLREHICCSGITPNRFPFRHHVRTVHGDTVHMHQTPGGLLKAGPVRITKCADPAINGLVHTVNSLFVEPHVPQRHANSRWDSEDPDVLFTF